MRPLGRCGRKRLKSKTGHISSSTSRPNQAQERAYSEGHNEAFIELRRWMKRRTDTPDWKLSQKLQPCYFPDTGRGMRACSSFKSGGCIVSIPLDLLITVDTVFAAIGPEIKRHRTVFTPQQVLTVFLTLESVKGRESAWCPYINTLPAIYSTPLYFTTQEVNMLCGKTKELVDTLRTRFQAACKEMMCFIHEMFPSLRKFVTPKLLKWAWSTVDTRSVFLETKKPHAQGLLNLKPEESNVALAPFLDMLNHSDTAQMTAGLNPVNNRYEIRTETGYNRYDQVFISYGPHDNTKLLVNYGFTLPRNINNCFAFSTGDIKSCFPGTEHWERKTTILKDCDLHKSLVCTMDGASWSLMTALKVIALPWDQLAHWKRLFQGMNLGEENEAAAITMACTLVKEALWNSKRHEKFVRGHPPSVHHNLILSLAEDDVQILQKSLQMLATQK